MTYWIWSNYLAKKDQKKAANELLERVLQTFHPVKDLKILQRDHSKFEGALLDHLCFSKSHTKDRVTVALADSIKSIGIDIERKDRKLKYDISSYIKHDEDKHSMCALELFCSKEAAFKALSNAGAQIKTVSSVKINTNSSFSFAGLSGVLIDHSTTDHLIKVALIK